MAICNSKKHTSEMTMKKLVTNLFTIFIFSIYGSIAIAQSDTDGSIKGRVLSGENCVYHLSVHFSSKHEYTIGSFERDVTACLRQGGKINYTHGYYLDKPIFALFSGYLHETRTDIDKALAFLISRGADVNGYLKDSSSILMHVIRKLGSQYYDQRDAERAALERCVILLINNGSNVNHEDNSGKTALFYVGNVNNASSPKYEIRIARKLIQSGASPTKRDDSGDYFIHRIFHRKYFRSMDLGLLNFFFEELDFDINLRGNYGRTMLHYAAQVPDVNAIKYLIARGADVKGLDAGHRTPLHLLGRNSLGYRDSLLRVAKLLISKGADVNALDKNGKTPLDWIKGIKTGSLDQRETQVKRELIEYLESHGGI